MTTDTGDAATGETWTCELSAPNYDDATLRFIHDLINAWPGEPGEIDAGDMQAYALEFIAQIREQARTIAAYESATGFLVRQGLVFVNQYGYVECLMCGAVKHGEAIRHMPDCAAEALRALVAEEGE